MVLGYFSFTFVFRSNLARQYRTKNEELEMKRHETLRISQDYEARMKQKEVCLNSVSPKFQAHQNLVLFLNYIVRMWSYDYLVYIYIYIYIH